MSEQAIKDQLIILKREFSSNEQLEFSEEFNFDSGFFMDYKHDNREDSDTLVPEDGWAKSDGLSDSKRSKY